MFDVLHLYYADPAQLLTTMCEELDGLDHALSEVCNFFSDKTELSL